MIPGLFIMNNYRVVIIITLFIINYIIFSLFFLLILSFLIRGKSVFVCENLLLAWLLQSKHINGILRTNLINLVNWLIICYC